MTQPLDEGDKHQPSNMTMITSTYIKYLESAGARVVPIHYNHTYEHIDDLMSKINGILFTGGDLNLVDPKTGEFCDFARVSNYIYNKAIELNENGIHFPLWGTCQGHQLLMLLESKDKEIITKCPRVYLPDSLNFKFIDQLQTKMYHDFPDELIIAAETQPITYNIHGLGIKTTDFYKNDNLLANYTLLSTNIDDNDNEYISSTEHKKYPFYTVQYHPERNIFKFDKSNIPHSQEAIELASLLAEKFVTEAKGNMNHFDTYSETIFASVEKTGYDEIDIDILDDTCYFKYAFP